MWRIFKELSRSNNLMKPMAAITSATPPLTYILAQNQNLFNAEVIADNPDLVAVSAELVKSFHGSLILFILLLSVINIYKPSKVIIFSLVLGGMALVASALLQTIGMVLITYGLGVVTNSVTFNRLIVRNDLLAKRKTEEDVERILREARR
jgi:hypothetical protein